MKQIEVRNRSVARKRRLRLFSIGILFVFLIESAVAQSFLELKVPAKPASGMKWQLQSISDDFDYEKSQQKKPAEFFRRWKDSYINPWLGPGLTEWNPDHAYTINGHLGIEANRKPGTEKVYLGCISSKETFTYPLFVEAKIKMNRLVLASNVWMLSNDSTQEIDIHEAYGSDRPGQEYYAKRLHLSHHVFIRNPFQDYQPEDKGSWYRDEKTVWSDGFHRVGVYWQDPWNLKYYVDGKLVRTVSGKKIIDPKGYTRGTGLSKPMHIIINVEDQAWRSSKGVKVTDQELADKTKSIMWVDWIRVYKAIPK